MVCMRSRAHSSAMWLWIMTSSAISLSLGFRMDGAGGDQEEHLASSKSVDESSVDFGRSSISQVNEKLHPNHTGNVMAVHSTSIIESSRRARVPVPDQLLVPTVLDRHKEVAALQLSESQNESSDMLHTTKLLIMQAQNQTRNVFHDTEKYVAEHLIEFAGQEDNGLKSKLVLSIIEFCCLGLCGIDRCYMGQVQLGLAKGLTGGGLLIWWLLDYGLIAYNCLSSSVEINGLEYSAKFKPGDEITAAFWICLVMNFVSIACLGSGTKMKARRSGRDARREGANTLKGMKPKVPEFAKIPNKMLQKAMKRPDPEPAIKRSERIDE